MPIDRSRVGAEYRAPEMVVTPESITRYADATGDPLNAYRAGPDSMAPPVFGIVPAWPAVVAVLEDRTLGLDVGRIVHGGQRMTFHRPIRAGDVLGSVGRLASVEDRGRNEVFVISLATVDGRGEPVCDQDVVCVSRGTAAAAAEGGAPDGASPRPSGAAAPEPPAETPAPDLERTVDVPSDVTYRYAEASGDRNRIHVDEAFAREAGLPGIIVHGMCLLAIAAQAVVEEAAGGDPARVHALDVRFARPIQPGRRFTTRVWRTPGGARFESVDADGLVLLSNGRVEVA